MSLTIQRLVTRCTIPRKVKIGQFEIDRIARESLPAACVQRLAARWPAEPDVIRIRRLHLRLRLPVKELNEERFAAAWAEAFAKSLFHGIARAGADSSLEAVRAPSRAAWLAQTVRHVLAGTAASRWEYSEFGECFSGGTKRAVLQLLVSEPREILDTLSDLETDGTSERLLRLLDDSQTERVFSVVCARSEEAGGRLDLTTLLRVGRVVAGGRVALSGERIDGHRLALRVFVSLYKERDGQRGTTPVSAGTVLDALIALAALLELIPESHCFSRAGGGEELVPAAMEVLARLGCPAESRGHWGGGELVSVLKAVREAIPATAPRSVPTSSVWRSVDAAGLLLLIPALTRLDWINKVSSTRLMVEHGPRLATYLLAGVALASLNRFEEEERSLPSGAGLFAGWIEEPRWGAFREFLASNQAPVRQELLAALGIEARAQIGGAVEWRAFFDVLAERLIREFGDSIRGFRQTSRGFIVREFLSLAGRVYVEEQRLRAVLDTTPFAVAVHTSGLDYPVESVSWLGGRRLEFVLQGI